MAESKRYAVVTGSNKGIGFEIVRQLASHGITVVLTARDEKRGLEAVQKLKESDGFSDDILLFHQLDVSDSSSVASLAEFIKNKFGRLDILVNNAGVAGVEADAEAMKAAAGGESRDPKWDKWDALQSSLTKTYESTVQCFEINYFGTRRMIEAFIPLLQRSQSPIVVNVSSTVGLLKNVNNEWAKGILSDVDNLTEERVDEVVNAFLKDFKEGNIEANGWPATFSAYTVSKVIVNAYTRVAAKKHKDIKINCVCPGYIKTDLNFQTGMLTPAEGAESIVRLALLPEDGPSVVTGANKGIGLEVVRQLAYNGITAVLTARDEKRGHDALKKLKESGNLSGDVIFHQLDVADSSSVASLAEFIKAQFGRLDILVNNAGVLGVVTDGDGFTTVVRAALGEMDGSKINWDEVMTQTYELAVNCMRTNYYGAKRMIEAFIPLLQLSQSPRIVNVSSEAGILKQNVVLTNLNKSTLQKERVNEVVHEFLKDFKEAAMNAYTRIVAKKQPNMKKKKTVKIYQRIGFEVVRQLASQEITVVLTARDEKRGLDALHKLKESSDHSGDIIFHQLDVADSSSVASLAEFIKAQFGRLDILVNNAGFIGVITDGNSFTTARRIHAGEIDGARVNWDQMMSQTYELAVNCMQTNYYGARRMIEALIPFLQLSQSPRIVNVSSVLGKLEIIPSERAKGILSNENLTEESVDEVVNEFLKEFREGSLESKGWPYSAYSVSKAALNAYTRIVAKKQPKMKVNCLCPGYVRTDLTFHTGILTAEEGAERIVRLVQLPDDGPSGLFFIHGEVSSF
ncbi:OLC1v1039159C1 [Oldenlandia corymbosa var. corymbosa]|uniref:OLC1v1039159C1 n=1 Tax=Oldenlandia corymbosa var. corymbosa TaxID=529605 RepID=A0AAV1D1V9_OLDCO|nr:OLC1v1039159C1 [Oldenlandia corymbosa var. corymbosa]